MNPIWKDITYTAQVPASGLEIIIREGSTVIYQGLIHTLPDGLSDFCINRICEHLLDTELPDFRAMTDNTVHNDNAYKIFTAYSVNGGTETLIGTYSFLNDWSYEEYGNGDRALSNPINGHMDSRMKLLYTAFRNNTGSNICYDEI